MSKKKEEYNWWQNQKDVEPFILDAKSGVGTHRDDPSLLLLGSQLDSSIKWVDVPGYGKRMVKNTLEMDVPGFGKKVCLDLGIDKDKTMYAMQHGGQYVVFNMSRKGD